MSFKVCIECPSLELSDAYKEELLKSFELRVKYELERDDFALALTSCKEDCHIFVTDCFDLSSSPSEDETVEALQSLFQLRWRAKTAVAIVLGFLTSDLLGFLSFSAFGVDIFEVPYHNPVLSHYICVRDGKFPDRLRPSLSVLFQQANAYLTLTPQMIALDLWPSIVHRATVPVAQALTRESGHGIAHGDKSVLQTTVEEIMKWVESPLSTPEFKNHLEFLFPLVDRLKQLNAIADTLGSKSNHLSSTMIETLSLLRKWPMDYALDALYRIGQHDHPWLNIEWPKWVFVVEDNPDVINALKTILESKGYKLHVNETALHRPDELTYHDIREWLKGKWQKTLDATNQSVILLDLGIGKRDRNSGLSGLEFLRKLKEEMPNITCLVISGYEQEVENALSLGADGYIIKPIKADILLEEIERLRFIGTVAHIWDDESRLAYLQCMESVRSTRTAPRETSEQKWELVLRGLEKFFASKRIRFFTREISENYPSWVEELVSMGEVDSFLIDCGKGIRTGRRPLFVDVARILKMQDNNKALTILLPPEFWYKRPFWLYQYLRGVFQEEIDNFQQKPLFRFALSDSECTLDAVYHQITYKQSIKYDVRYTILFPIEPVFARFEEQILKDSTDETVKMFVIPVIKTFGFSVPMDLLINELARNESPERGSPKYELFKTILMEMGVRHKNWEGFWRGKEIENIRIKLESGELEPYECLGEEMVSTINGKLKGLSDMLRKSRGLVTFESWVRKQIDCKMRNYWKTILIYFGGDTRIELFLRGDWLNEAGQPVEDILILVYVLTRYAPTNQQWLKTKVLQRMKEELGEDVVFLQEERVKVFEI
jgi:CheY-like chemotaxis protein